jgi:thiosulfate dehydrogenase
MREKFTKYLKRKDVIAALIILIAASSYLLPDKSDKWNLPDVSSIKDPDAQEIAYGKMLISQTPKYIGPEMKDTSMRFSGNHMACTNCHIEDGQTKHTLSLVGASYRYPRNDARRNGMETLEDRINGCLERSMNGRSMDDNSTEMKAMVKYIKWMSSFVEKDINNIPKGLPDMPMLYRAASPVKGKKIFLRKCIVCHANNGNGILNNHGHIEDGYSYPPLWGNDSFNDGAGLHRLIMCAKFIKFNMPYKNPNLSVDEAYDVAAYVNSMPRPAKKGLEADYPDRKRKPIDSPFPPYIDTFSVEQHKLGPYQQMTEGK